MQLIAGPWVGEFGWELFCWHAFLRTLSNDHPITVVSRKSSEYLYRDFATGFIPWEPPGWGPANMNAWGGRADWPLPEKPQAAWVRTTDTRYWGEPIEFKPFGAIEPTYFKFGKEDKGYDVICCARNRRFVPEYNWEQEKWNELAGRVLGSGMKAASIGMPEDSLLVEGTDDLRGIDLEPLANALRSSGVMIGPSTGTLHFGALCSCPRIVWSGMESDSERYMRFWNPFQVKTKHIFGSYDPSVDEIWKEVKAWA